MSGVLPRPSGLEREEELPQTFEVKYLGRRTADGLWGIRNTRKPVESMISYAKQPGTCLSQAKLLVSKEGCSLMKNAGDTRSFPIETISYGVQDLVYTRVFSMIVVKDVADPRSSDKTPFECHAFVCESRQTARQLTYCLASAFRDYSRRQRSSSTSQTDGQKKFAIDLRSPDEIRADLQVDSEA